MTALSFPDSSLDHIVSLEVLEHVPDFRRALRECARVLRPGGSILLSVPFHRGERHLVRARCGDDGTIEHIEPPEYHGDPVDPQGCLCFYHFGWELMDDFLAAGFQTAVAAIFWSLDLCYTDGGGESIQFLAQK
jgi:SAM-dependent methyltransferase